MDEAGDRRARGVREPRLVGARQACRGSQSLAFAVGAAEPSERTAVERATDEDAGATRAARERRRRWRWGWGWCGTAPALARASATACAVTLRLTLALPADLTPLRLLARALLACLTLTTHGLAETAGTGIVRLGKPEQ